MKFVILGAGSIGQRHAKNLCALGHSVRTIDIDEIGVADEILSFGEFDAGFVCTPTHLHLDHCELLLRHSLSVFCEKPLANDFDAAKIERLIEISDSKSLQTMVGCNMRFHSKILELPEQQVKDAKIATLRFGYDLRKWRKTDPRATYSAHKSQGGGIVLEVIHEFDYAVHLFGRMSSMTLDCAKVGTTTVDAEDVATCHVKFASGVIATICADSLSDNYERWLGLAGDNGRTTRYILTPEDSMYEREVEYFATKVANKEKCQNSLAEAADLLKDICDCRDRFDARRIDKTRAASDQSSS